jgi:hypothetical protein
MIKANNKEKQMRNRKEGEVEEEGRKVSDTRTSMVRRDIYEYKVPV